MQGFGQAQFLGNGVDDGVGLSDDSLALVDPGFAKGTHHPPERRHAVTVHRREVRSAKYGRPSGVQNTDMGHPPEPVSSWVAVM